MNAAVPCSEPGCTGANAPPPRKLDQRRTEPATTLSQLVGGGVRRRVEHDGLQNSAVLEIVEPLAEDVLADRCADRRTVWARTEVAATYPLRDYAKAFEQASRPGADGRAGKVFFTFGGL